MALTDTEDFFRLSVIAMPKRRSIFDFREQRAKQPCLHGYLATAATVSVIWMTEPQSWYPASGN